MSAGAGFVTPLVHDAQAMRRAGAELLSLALMDARRRTLAWLAAFDGLPQPTASDEFDPPLWLVGQAAWFQEYWGARHVQRRRGEAADPSAVRLASILPMADACFDPLASTRAERWAMALPEAEPLRDYLEATLEATLDLLDGRDDSDEALHVFRLALHREDLIGEALAVLAQAVDLAPARLQPLMTQGLWPELPSRGRREPLLFAGCRMQLGSPVGGWVPDAERWAHPVQLDEFEIDALPVGWAQYAEFVADGGYDERRWWSDAGWQWLQASGRRAPRYVEQFAGGVLARRNGRLQRIPGAQPALHVSAHEAGAWCRWAGRRLPIEAEWELAASSASARGFGWGEVLEWVAGSARPYPGSPAAAAPPGAGGTAPRVLRGASVFASARLRHPRARRFVEAGDDALFCGFRSCAL